MERRSDLHGPRLDDQMEHEVESMTRGQPVEARADDDRLLEDAGDDEPEPEPLVALVDEDEGSPALSRDEVRDRSELARHLRGSIFPASRDDVVACAVDEHAPPGLVNRLRRLPEGEYRNVEGVWEALGGRRDERSPEGDVEDPAGAAERRAVIPEPAPSPLPGPGPVPEPPPVPEPEPLPEPEPRPQPIPEPRPPIDERATEVASRHFGFRFALPFRAAALPFLVRPASASVVIESTPDGDIFRARYGRWCVETPLDNIIDVAITGPYSTIKTIGPAHVSLSDRGLTFASNRDRGVCIRFAEPVRGIDALGVVRHPALTVTVDDVSGLEEALRTALGA